MRKLIERPEGRKQVKTQFYTDGHGIHRATMEPENDVERAMIGAMKMYKIKVAVSAIPSGPSGDVAGLELTFREDDRNV